MVFWPTITWLTILFVGITKPVPDALQRPAQIAMREMQLQLREPRGVVPWTLLKPATARRPKIVVMAGVAAPTDPNGDWTVTGNVAVPLAGATTGPVYITMHQAETLQEAARLVTEELRQFLWDYALKQ